MVSGLLACLGRIKIVTVVIVNTREFIWHKLLRRPYTLAATQIGKGEPLLFLHGLGANHEIWLPLMRRLTKNWRSIAPDLLGFGQSPRPDWKEYSVHDHVRSVVATLNKLGIKQPVTIMAHSMGCLVAAHLATAYPKRVKRLVLYAPPLFADEPVFPKHARRRQRYFAFFEYIATHPQVIFLQRRWLWRFAKRQAGVDMDEEKWLPFERSLRNTIMSQQAYQELLNIHVPTDIVHGRLDVMVTRAELDKMLESNKYITQHVVTSAHNVSAIPVKYLARLLEST